MSACAELILRFAQVNVRPIGEVKVNFLALLGNFRFLLKRLKVLIKLFQKFAEHDHLPSASCKSGLSAYASIFLQKNTRFAQSLELMRKLQLSLLLQTSEALLLKFGQSQYFPNVGKYCALSPLRALRVRNGYRVFVPSAGSNR